MRFWEIDPNVIGTWSSAGVLADAFWSKQQQEVSAKFVLHHKQVYRLDQTGEEKVQEFAGQKVKITGRVRILPLLVCNLRGVGNANYLRQET